MTDLNALTTCDELTQVLECYDNYQQDCSANGQVRFLHQAAQHDFYTLDCHLSEENGTNTTVSNVTQQHISDPCPIYPNNTVINPMNHASISPRFFPSGCTESTLSSPKQCSLFMDSQLRAFDLYRNGIETCSLPGKWLLLQHSSLRIEVEGRNMELGSYHTRLTKINVTFPSDNSCNPIARSYAAYNSEPLPSEFMPSFTAMEKLTSPLQLVHNRTVTTLLATWLNTTIIIRQYASFLSISIKVPRKIAVESDGLCKGCPAHHYINIDVFNSLLDSNCPEEHNNVVLNCYDHGGIVNQDQLITVRNNSYLDACIYSMHKIKNNSVISMFNAIANDARLLAGIENELFTDNQLTPTTLPATTSAMVRTSTNSPISSSISLYFSTLTLVLLMCVTALVK